MTSASAAVGAPVAAPPPTREVLQAHLFLECMLPLCDVALRHTPPLARAIGLATRVRPRATRTQWRVPALALCVGTHVEGGRVRAAPEPRADDVAALTFAGAAEVARFFTGAPPLPVALQLVRAPLAFAPIVASLARLRVLAEPDRARTAAARALFVDAALCLIALGLSRLARAGHAGAAGVARGPHRVFQWTVGGADLASYWRVERGKSRAGRGTYAAEPPFVHVHFATVDAAFRALAGRGSQMERLRSGDVETTGSPEYARRVTELLWDLDQLMLAAHAGPMRTR